MFDVRSGSSLLRTPNLELRTPNPEKPMSRFLLGRLAATIPVLLGVWFLVFMMLHLVPGDPVKIMLADFQTNPQQVELLRSQLHLDDPLPKQFGRFVANAARGDLGLS